MSIYSNDGRWIEAKLPIEGSNEVASGKKQKKKDEYIACVCVCVVHSISISLCLPHIQQQKDVSDKFSVCVCMFNEA